MFADMSDNTQPNLARLLDIMARLRDPDTGCPWDVAQSFATIAPYTIEEAYEVADAIERGDMGALKDELGDLLLQAVFHARMAEEQGLFAFDDVAGAIADKLVRRHPHVFGDEPARQARAAFSVDVWEASKADERKTKAKGNGGASPLSLLVDQERCVVTASGGFQVSVEPLAAHCADEFVALLGVESSFVFWPFDISLLFSGQIHLHRLDHQFMKFFSIQV